jgi:hypothetical protein
VSGSNKTKAMMMKAGDRGADEMNAVACMNEDVLPVV